MEYRPVASLIIRIFITEQCNSFPRSNAIHKRGDSLRCRAIEMGQIALTVIHGFECPVVGIRIRKTGIGQCLVATFHLVKKGWRRPEFGNILLHSRVEPRRRPADYTNERSPLWTDAVSCCRAATYVSETSWLVMILT